MMSRLTAAAAHDANVFRALLETVLCVALPQEVIARPGMKEKIAQSARNASPPVPGPGRRQPARGRHAGVRRERAGFCRRDRGAERADQDDGSHVGPLFRRNPELEI
jgi:hypothetical protein